MSSLLAWLDHRTGYRAVVHDALYEHVPGGARWRYVWGSTLVFCFAAQVVTGIVLWMAYSPSTQTAWESVYYIQHKMTAGWLLRGVHHFTAHIMVMLLALHFVQVVIDGAYRAPREINFWLGLILLQIVMAMGLTGYLLPWDQKGYWATKVATNMIALVPMVGGTLQRLVVGGDYGHHTLTRFFALHAGVLPSLLAVFLVMHIALFRRHGLTVRDPQHGPDTTFWPAQVLRDTVACLAVMIVVLVLVLSHDSHPMTKGGSPMAYSGAELSAPADPAENYSAARPETYFLFLFQLLKYLEKFPPIVGAIVVPGLVMLTLFLMPFVGRWKLGHRFNVVWTFALLIGAGVLTILAWREDHNGVTEHSKHYFAAVANAEAQALRIIMLANSPTGIPPTGALELLRGDPKIQGPKLFKTHCAACHSHVSPDSLADPSQQIAVDKPTASNLWRFGSREWVAGILDPEKIAGPHYFGNTALKEGDMVTWVNDNIGVQLEELKDEKLAEYRRQVEDVTIAVAAEAELPGSATPDLAERIAAGRDAIVNGFACIECHKLDDEGALGMAPDLTGYASREWLTAFMSNPKAERFYPETNDRMPAFAAHADNPSANRLTAGEIDLLVSWLRGEWYEPESVAVSNADGE
jgi:ubiquinol-cytochrome c reductase cytochrome b subunit